LEIVYQRFNLWAKSGVFERVFKLLARDHDSEYMMIHSADAQKAARKQFAGPARTDNQIQRLRQVSQIKRQFRGCPRRIRTSLCRFRTDLLASFSRREGCRWEKETTEVVRLEDGP